MFIADNVLIAFGITIAAGLATVLGSALVFLQKTPSPRMLAFGLAFAAGAMVFVSLTEIFNKSTQSFAEVSTHGFSWATVAFLVGVLAIMLIDRLIPNPHETPDVDSLQYQTGSREYLKSIGLMAAFAITAHNLPEGMATFFATLEDPNIGAPLAFAIAVHNIPEGISIAAPIYFATGNRRLTVIACLISGMAEPFGAAIGYFLLKPFLSPEVFGWVFGIIAGAMVFLAMDELLPAAKRYSDSHETVYGLVGGMGLIAISLALFNW